MTDITELALLVSKAKASVFTLEYISQFEPADIDSDDVDLRFEVDGMDTGTNVSIVDECGQAAKVIGELVEALEKVQQRNVELENYAEAEATGADKAAEDSVYWMKRCKELESRTVTVKLPDEVDMLLNHLEDVLPFEVFQLIDAHKWNAVSRLSAAGIKCEVE
ncbi:ead/Ea22-like family protein [Klebsiella pneumoniae]|uniref:ead/Ea22-like family protein n=1 Tax=Klebsiella pneumoniae TaxID=573 RepID=UPI000DE75A8F|nr:ead/Ea22-like family protein [Klebsiella pneumoniae]SSN58967.1 Uncharacterised protein [Klebsiella pneumoniae]HBR3598387.1 ead/Ea22-like family protein [Klebsiella pneumoniae]HBR3725764.1 ead/Ea22-like family protein [Klebsiella pneumoniae]